MTILIKIKLIQGRGNNPLTVAVLPPAPESRMLEFKSEWLLPSLIIYTVTYTVLTLALHFLLRVTYTYYGVHWESLSRLSSRA